MKNLLVIGSVLTLISTSAMASQARLLALGMKETDNDGMYHISDARNIFLNPAYVNIYNNYVVAEYGKDGLNISRDTTYATASNTTLDADASPKAQGGFFAKYGDFVYGLYVGNESNTSSLLRIVGTSAIAAMNGTSAINATTNVATGVNSKMLDSADNQFDLFFGGDTGLKWGLNTTFATGKEDSRKAKDSSLALRGGLMGSGWDAHLNLSLMSKAESTDSVSITLPGTAVTGVSVAQEFKGKLGLQLGGSYVIAGNNRIFGYVKHYSWEQKDSFTGYAAIPAAYRIGGQSGTVKGDFTSALLGWGTHYDVNTSDKLFVSFAAKKTDINAKFNTKGEISNLVLPLTIGYEAVATEWLTLRGSVVQNIWGTRDNKNYGSINQVGRGLMTSTFGAQGKGTIAASTEVNGGATFTFGKLALDGLVGAKTAAGTLRTDNLLTRLALTYNF